MFIRNYIFLHHGYVCLACKANGFQNVYLVALFMWCYILQTIECDQLFLAAEQGDIITIEMLLYTKFIDVNTTFFKVTSYNNSIAIIEMYMCIATLCCIYKDGTTQLQLHTCEIFHACHHTAFCVWSAKICCGS